MNRQFATLRELVAGDTQGVPAGDVPIEESRAGFRRGQVTARIVMVDRRCPYDPEDAIVMLLAALEGGGLARMALTRAEVEALLGFCAAEFGAGLGQAAETLRLRERVADLEARIAAARLKRVMVTAPGERPRLGRPLSVQPRMLAALLHTPVATHEMLAREVFGVERKAAMDQIYGGIARLKPKVAAAGGRIEGVQGVGWRLVADREALSRLSEALAGTGTEEAGAP